MTHDARPLTIAAAALAFAAHAAAEAPRSTPQDRPSAGAPARTGAGTADDLARALAGDLDDGRRLVFYDWLDDTGTLRGGPVLLPPADALEPTFAMPAGVDVETIRDAGDPANRLDVVIVGDGFTLPELPAYAERMEIVVDQFFEAEPWATYRDYINIHRVDVRSPESGVDNDPVPGIERDTALDMEFWCQGVERLLCASTSKAWAFAGLAPEADQVWAVANSDKYGGTGYLEEDVTTFPSTITTADWLLIHEFGHAFAELADEYWTSGATWNGPELPFTNVSIRTRFEMLQQETKWWRWIGAEEPLLGGEVGALEGGWYHEFGIRRPAETSRMRSIGQPFNLVSLEALVAQIHRDVNPIDGGTPPGQTPTGSVLEVVPMQPIGHDLEITWLAGGEEIPGTSGQTSIDLAAVGPIPPGTIVQVLVVDPTEWVIDPAIRNTLLTGRRIWALQPACPGDLDGSGRIDWPDLVRMIEAWGPCSGPCFGDLDDDGAVDADDLTTLLATWGDC